MNADTLRDLVAAEDEKRRRCADPVAQWKTFLQTCAWIDSQQAVPRNSKAGCLAQQAQRAASMRSP